MITHAPLEFSTMENYDMTFLKSLKTKLFTFDYLAQSIQYTVTLESILFKKGHKLKKVVKKNETCVIQTTKSGQ